MICLVGLIVIGHILFETYVFFNLERFISKFKIEYNEPEEVNYILSFGGGFPDRERKAFDLYKKYPDSKWVLSSNHKIEFFEKRLESKIDKDRVISITDSRSTFEEIYRFRALLEKANPQKDLSIVLVSSWWHLRRIKAISCFLLYGYEKEYIPSDKEGSMKDNTTKLKNEFFDYYFDLFRSILFFISFGNIVIMADSNI